MSHCTYDCGRAAEAGKSRCRTCRRSDKAGQRPSVVRPSPMRVLLLDIETSPNLGYVWSLWQQNVGLNQLVETTEMMCFAAKWLGGEGTQFWSAHESGRGAMVRAAHALLDNADVVMHYNGTSFDVKHLNREFIEAGLNPPSPFKQIDLMLAVKKNFRFPSNKLQYVSTALGLSGKTEHEGFGLWTKCMAGDAKAWKQMEKYNRQDVELLEELYEKLLPWVPSLPNRRLYGDEGCPACGSHDLRPNGYAYTGVSKFRQFRCGDCGSYFRENKRQSGVDLVAVAR